MGQLRALYANLAALGVTFTTEDGPAITVAALGVHQLPKTTIPAANAPLRLILPYSVFTGADNGQFITPRGGVTVDWTLADLLLWRPGTLAEGIAASAADLIRYQDAYVDALADMAQMGVTGAVASRVKLKTWRIRPGMYDWPIGGNVWWQGCMAALTVAEIR